MTDRGLSDIKAVAAFVAAAGVTVSQILHSGKPRARQTAEVLAAAIGGANASGKVVAQTDGLNPSDDPKIWAGRIQGMKDDSMLVGHLPHLSRLASLLLCGDEAKNVVSFMMAGVVCLKKEENGWSVKWMVTPEMVS